MRPILDNLEQLVDSSESERYLNEQELSDKVQEIFERGIIQAEALNFIRGRSIIKTYLIIDEAQNLTPNEIKTIITRAGEGTKMVFTGDIQQIDQPYLDSQSNGLVYMIDRMKDQHLFAHVNLIKGERSELSELASNLL